MHSTLRRGVLVLTATAFLAAGSHSHAAQYLPGPDLEPVTLSARWSAPQARPGEQLILAVILDVDAGLHINPDRARLPDGDFRIATTIAIESDHTALAFGPVQWPAPESIEVNLTGTPERVEAYHGRVIAYVPTILANDARATQAVVSLTIDYQACTNRQCLMPTHTRIDIPLTILAADGGKTLPAGDPALFAAFDRAAFSAMPGAAATRAVRFDLFGWELSLDPTTTAGFALFLLMAALGGLLLNFTPCVLPVIPIKIMGLAQVAGNRARCLTLGLTMSLGVIGFWLVLGGLIATVAGFTATNQLFQYPAFTVSVGAVIALMAIGMCGVFSLRLPAAVYRFNPRQDSHGGSFGFGIMTAILSTPCTAPFMGAAAAWSATQPARITFAVFSAIGAGMALPYAILSAMPRLVRRMPRGGPASELIKQVMGLLMLAAAAYFIGVGIASLSVTPPDPPSRNYWWPVGALIALAGGWLAWRTVRITSRTPLRLVFGGLGAGLLLLGVAIGSRLSATGPIDWLPYNEARFAEARERGEVVVMDFTAEWCLNCKTLEATVLHDPAVLAAMRQDRVTPIKVDLTANHPDGSAMLQRTGRVAIPLLVVFAADGAEVFKSDFYTAGQVTDAIATALGRSPPRPAAR